MRPMILCLVLLMLYPFVASGEFVQWVDEDGVTHFSDRYSNVPEKNKNKEHTKTPGENELKGLGEQDQRAKNSVTPFALSGRIIDIYNRMLKSLLDEGAPADGKTIDQIGRKLITITAFSNKTRLQTLHPDERLAFRLFSEQSIDHITIEVSGCGIYYKAKGPWSKETELSIDLEEGLFEIGGLVRSRDLKPVVRGMVSAFDETNEKVSFCYTNSKGRFLFYTNTPIQALSSSADGLEIKKIGPFCKKTDVVLSTQEKKLFAIRGLVTDKNGAPLKNVRISASFLEGGGKSAMTDEDGRYELHVDKTITHLYLYREITRQEKTINGPFDGDQTVNMTLDQADVYILNGQVVDTNGGPVYNAFVYATDSVGSRIKTTRTDRSGKFMLEMGKEAMSVTAYLLGSETKSVVKGPFQNDTNVKIILKQPGL